jgi:cytidyltransferase-like protein
VKKITNLKQFKNSHTGKTVLVGGCFDLIHIGHLDFIKKAKAQGDVLLVALEHDDFIKHTKGKTPFHTQRQRAELLSSLIYVDEVIVLPFLKTDSDYLSMVKQIKPHVIAVTKHDPQLANKKNQAKIIGAHVLEVIDYEPGYSSTLMKEYLNKHKDAQ